MEITKSRRPLEPCPIGCAEPALAAMDNGLNVALDCSAKLIDTAEVVRRTQVANGYSFGHIAEHMKLPRFACLVQSIRGECVVQQK